MIIGHAPRNLPYVKSGKLMLNGGPWRFIGANNIDLMGFYTGGFQTETQIGTFFSLFPKNTVHRTYWTEEYSGGGTSGHDQAAIVERQARKYGQKLIIALSDGTGASTTPSFTASWYTSGYAGTDAAHQYGAPPYPNTTTNYLNWISHICGAYKNSPAIAVWEISNEPATSGGVSGLTASQMATWTNAAATAVKNADPNHLVSSGFHGAYNKSWCANNTDFQTIHTSSAVDLISTHEYSHAFEGGKAHSSNVNNACAVASALGKPVYVGESGVGNNSGTVTVATRASELTSKFDCYLGKTQDATDCPNAFTYPACGVLYFDLAINGANGGDSTNKSYCSDPQTSGTIINTITGYAI